MSRELGSERCLTLRGLTEAASSSFPNLVQTITSELPPVRKTGLKKCLKKVFFGVHPKARPPQKAGRNFLSLVGRSSLLISVTVGREQQWLAPPNVDEGGLVLLGGARTL